MLSPAAVGVPLLVLNLLLGGSARPDGAEAIGIAGGQGLFDPEAGHPWDRLHRFFYVREVANGQTYAHHGPDAPFGREGTFLVEGPSHTKALEALDIFLKARDDERVDDPLKRALLQRDLWYVFDKLAEPPPANAEPDRDPIADRQPQRRAVQKRLAQVMRRLEQPAARLRALPDNYAIAVKSGTFPSAFDPRHPDRPYLPPDLRPDGGGDWILISPQSTWLAAPRHAQFAGGRSVFLPLLRLPDGRKQAEEYLTRMPADRDQGFEQLPDGSQVALVRRMLLVDDTGGLQATPVTESVQLRIFPKGAEQRSFEFTLDRAGLLSGRGGLRAVGADEGEYFGFDAGPNNQFDPFGGERAPEPNGILSRCIGCHRGEKLFGIITLGFGLIRGYQGADQTDLATQVRHTKGIKKNGFSWGLLQGLRETTPP